MGLIFVLISAEDALLCWFPAKRLKRILLYSIIIYKLKKFSNPSLAMSIWNRAGAIVYEVGLCKLFISRNRFLIVLIEKHLPF